MSLTHVHYVVQIPEDNIHSEARKSNCSDVIALREYIVANHSELQHLKAGDLIVYKSGTTVFLKENELDDVSVKTSKDQSIIVKIRSTS